MPLCRKCRCYFNFTAMIVSIMGTAMTQASEVSDAEFISGQQLSEEVDRFLQSYYVDNDNWPDARYQIEVDQLDPRLRLGSCDKALEFEIKDQNYLGGNLSCRVVCNGSQPWSVYVPSHVAVFAPVATLRHSLPRGHLITEDDLLLRELDISRYQHGYALTSSQLLGLELRRNQGAGEVLRLSSLQEPLAIEKGDIVVVEARNESVAVSTTAEALRPGRIGEQIPVRNVSSERIIRARVIARGRVEIQW